MCVEHPRASAILHFEKGFKGFSVKNKKLFLVNPTSLDNVSVVHSVDLSIANPVCIYDVL